MPTPTSSTANRSDRFSRLADQATKEFPRMGFEPDEANGTTEGQISYTGQIEGRGSVRVVMAISAVGIHMTGTLILPNAQTIPLRQDLTRESLMDCRDFDRYSDDLAVTALKGMIRKFVTDAQPRNSKMRRLALVA